MTTETVDKSKEETDQKSTAPKKLDLSLLDEDDEFEEFPNDDWEAKTEEETENFNYWEDEWDDETYEDDFVKQLRNELEKNAAKKEEMKDTNTS